MARRPVNYEKLNNRLVKSGAEFTQALNELLATARTDIDQTCKQAMADLHNSFVQASPKDTGRTAASFMIADNPEEIVFPPGEYRGGLNRVMAENRNTVENMPPLQMMYIVNNTPYLPSLENGHSKQAPKGFLAVTITAWARKFNAMVAEFNAKKE